MAFLNSNPFPRAGSGDRRRNRNFFNTTTFNGGGAQSQEDLMQRLLGNLAAGQTQAPAAPLTSVAPTQTPSSSTGFSLSPQSPALSASTNLQAVPERSEPAPIPGATNVNTPVGGFIPPFTFDPPPPVFNPIPENQPEVPPVAVANQSDVIANAGGGLGDTASSLEAQIQERLKALGQGPAIPSFEELFQNFTNIANEQGDLQSARIREAFGSRGGRFGSDLLNAEGANRRKIASDIALGGNQIQLGLRNARTQEQDSLLQNLFGIAGLDQQSREAALQRLFQEFQNLPPEIAFLANLASSFPTGDNVVSA